MVRTWVRSFGAALAAAVVLGAGQLGVAYGFGILRWDQAFSAQNAHLWTAHLTWVAFIAALAVAGGAVAGVRAIRRHQVRDGVPAWITVSLAALVGAAVTVPLVALPAREAQVPLPLDPALNAGLVAGLGVAVGFFAALAVLCARLAAGSVLVTAVWVWLLGLGSAFAAPSEQPGPGQRLGVLDLPALSDGVEQDLVLPVMVGAAVLTSAAIAGYAHWLGEPPFAVAASGLAGPALVAAAYLIAGPGVSGDQRQPWLAALVAVGAGLGVSILVALALRRSPAASGSRPLVVSRSRPPVAEGSQPPAVNDEALPADSTMDHHGLATVRDEDYVNWVSGLGNHEAAGNERLTPETGDQRANASVPW